MEIRLVRIKYKCRLLKDSKSGVKIDSVSTDDLTGGLKSVRPLR